MTEELFDAVEAEDVERVSNLLNTGIDINSTNERGEYPISRAAERGNKELVKMFLAHDADAESRILALWNAITNDDSELVKVIIDSGAIVNGRHQNCSLLFWAVALGKEKMVKLLLDAGAEKNSINLSVGWSPLMWASKEGNEAIVRYLLDYGADTRFTDIHGIRAIQLAESNYHQHIVEMLKSAEI